MELYNIADTIAKNIIKNEPDIKKSVKLARETINKDVLKRFVIAGNLNNEQMALLNTKTSEVKFSLDSLIKNIIKHSEIDHKNYTNIQNYLFNYDKIVSDKEFHIKIFKKENNKIFELVIKTTQNRNENFIVSCHSSNIRRMKK